MYTNYQFHLVNTLGEYQEKCKEFERQQNVKIEEELIGGKKTARIVRELGFFEKIYAFFELVFSSLGSLVLKKNSDSERYLKNAWLAFKRHEWVRIIQLKAPESKVEKLKNRFQPAKVQSSSKSPTKPANPTSSKPAKPASIPAQERVQANDLMKEQNKKQFETQLIEIVQAEEAHSKPKINNVTNKIFRENVVEDCFEAIGNLEIPLDSPLVYEKIDEMVENPLEMQALAKRLSYNGNHGRLKTLLLREKQYVGQPSLQEKRQKRLCALFPLLSESQFDAMIQSSGFLGMCGIQECRAAITQTFTAAQLGKLAASWKNGNTKNIKLLEEMIKKIQDCLKEVIKGLPDDKYLLGKLHAVLPHLCHECKEAVINKIAHLPLQSRPHFPYDPKKVDQSQHCAFIKKLEELTLYYVKENEELKARLLTVNNQATQPSAKPKKEQKKWKVDTSYQTKFYNTEKIQKSSLKKEQLIQLIDDLESPYKDPEEIRNTLSLMDQDSVKAFVTDASPKALRKYWNIESKTVNAGTKIEDRTERLKWVFSSLSEGQLKDAIDNCEDFLKILTDNLNGNSRAAAEAFSVKQLGWIIPNWRAHEYLVSMIMVLENQKFAEFLPLLTPHCTPFLLGYIQKKINMTLSITDKKKKIEACENSSKRLLESNQDLSRAWLLFYGKNPGWGA